jgi:hypothetical protein
MIHGKTKCRRAGCGHTHKMHATGPNYDATNPGAAIFGCYETDCACSSFIGPDDVAKPPRKAPSNAESMYREAFAAGIREAAPDVPFVVTGSRIGSIVGPVAAQHAPGVGGAELLAWIRESAREFRRDTAKEPQFWGGWQPYNWAKWKNMGPRKTGGTRPNMLQPAPPVTVRSIGRK